VAKTAGTRTPKTGNPMQQAGPDADAGQMGTALAPAGKKCGARTRICQCGHHMKNHDAKRGACGCGKCQAFQARLCQGTKLGRGGRCRQHGGMSLAGAAHPGFRWDKALPSNFKVPFQAAMKDRTLLHLRQDIALVDAMLTTYMAGLSGKKGGKVTLTDAQEQRIMALTEQRRRLGESEARRLRDLRQVVTREQFTVVMGFLSGIIREYVPGERLAEVQKRVQQFLLNSLGQKADAGPGGD